MSNKIILCASLLLCACICAADVDEIAETAWRQGRKYETGDGVRLDKRRAFNQYKKAAERKHPQACLRMAEFYEKGEFVAKSPEQAAKYRAWAKGEQGPDVEKSPEVKSPQDSVDAIELALDFLLGRRGKTQDVKAGLRLLFTAGKDSPSAQRVFVKEWCKGHLDDALSALTDEEWDIILPWYEDAYRDGIRGAGLVLGNRAYDKKNYSAALSLWRSCGLAKGWFYMAVFYDPFIKEGKCPSGPESMKSARLACNAYEKCLALDPSYFNARYNLSGLYLYGRDFKCDDLTKAFKHLEYLYRHSPNDEPVNEVLYDYGFAGLLKCNEDLKKMDEKYQKNIFRDPETGRTVNYNSPASRRAHDTIYAEYRRQRARYVGYIRRAADKGYDTAKKFLNDFKE